MRVACSGPSRLRQNYEDLSFLAIGNSLDSCCHSCKMYASSLSCFDGIALFDYEQRIGIQY